MLVKVLHKVLFVAGYLAITILASLVSYYGKPELGLSIFGIATTLVLMLAVTTGIVNIRHKRTVKAAQEARTATASAPPTTHRVQATEEFGYDAQTVWSLIRPAENAVLLTDAQRAFTVPGTPNGVGRAAVHHRTRRHGVHHRSHWRGKPLVGHDETPRARQDEQSYHLHA
jgi:hypothetical protein